MTEVESRDNVFFPEDLAQPVELKTNIELWDIGLYSDGKLSPTVSFQSDVMNVEIQDVSIRSKANIFRVAVDPGSFTCFKQSTITSTPPASRIARARAGSRGTY